MSSMSLTQQGRERKARIDSGKNRANWNFSTIQELANEGGSIWTYEGPSYNTDAYREGWDRIFGKKEKINGC